MEQTVVNMAWDDADKRYHFAYDHDGTIIDYMDDDNWKSVDPSCIWTYLDDGTTVSGVHYVNRVAYYRTSFKVEDGIQIIISQED